MKSLKDLGFGSHVYLIEDKDLPFEVSKSEQTPTTLFAKHEPKKISKEALGIKKASAKERKSMGATIEKTVDQLIEALKKRGIHLLRYNAYSTKSVYLKMDWGVLATIRVSDHLGKAQYPYKYNLITTAKKGQTFVDQGIVREFYTIKEIEALIRDIEMEREEKWHKYGRSNYQKYIEENKKKAVTQKGFFEQAWEV